MRGYVARAMKFRAANPAMWRGDASFMTMRGSNGADILTVIKRDEQSGNKVAVIFSDKPVTLKFPSMKEAVRVKALVPEFVDL